MQRRLPPKTPDPVALLSARDIVPQGGADSSTTLEVIDPRGLRPRRKSLVDNTFRRRSSAPTAGRKK